MGNALLSCFAPRVAETQTLFKVVQSELYFIKGDKNPVDISTKSISLEILRSPNYWRTSFLELTVKMGNGPLSTQQGGLRNSLKNSGS